MSNSMTCDGCIYYQPTFETCGALAGRLRCGPCNTLWKIDGHGVHCPICKQMRHVVDASECPNAIPSKSCPDREEPEVVRVQGSLF